MAQFMSEHPDLAKNLLPNCAQGEITSNRLWEELTKKLNAAGPPTKDAKLWKKAFADQKYNAKKKLCFNKASKQLTGGGPFHEKSLTSAEELLVEAAGLEACVEGNKSVPEFGNVTSPFALSNISESSSSGSNVASTSVPIYTTAHKTPSSRTPRITRPNDSKTLLLEQNMKSAKEHQESMGIKFYRLLKLNEKQLEISHRQLEINERMLKIKEQKHRIQNASREVDYEIKCLQLESLKGNARR